MAADEKWYFTKEQLINTPSRKCGIDADKELSYRQQAANFIQDMGQRLQVSQLCINTAIVYMHRFYVFHSLTQFHRNSISAAAIFLAAKVEEQPRKLEHVIRMAFKCLNKGDIDVKSEMYLEQVQDLVFNENVLLQTLGFDVAIDHPHTHVVKCCYLVKANKDLSQTSYFMASNSLHLTTMCLQYKPTVVACFCIHLACKWSHLEIPQSAEGKNWFWYVDKTVTSELLAQLTGEFLHIFDKCPSKLKRKIRSISANQSPSIHQSSSLLRSPFDSEPRRVMQSSPSIDSDLSFQSNRLMSFDKSEIDGSKKLSSGPSGRTVDLREYREKNRERQEREKAAVTNAALGSSQNVDPSKHHSHHHKQSSSGVPVPSKHSSSSSSAMKQAVHHNHHHHHHHSSRQDVKSSQMMSQRHSTSGSSNSSGGSNSNSNRDPNRERQRMSREYSSSGSYSSHNHSLDNILDASMGSLGADVQTVHPPEKLNNTLPKMHGDLRHSKQQKDMKPYPKFADPTRSRKPDILEQRSEEVRKLIEKPLPPPKPRAEGLKEEYAAMMLKQSHHPSKYGHQAEKPIPSTNMSQASLPTLTGSDSKMLNVGQTAFTTEKSPNAPVSASQISQKSLSSSKTSQAKNGSLSTSATSSFSLVNNLDDVKTDKKPRISDQDNAAVPTPPNKHRSLFSPEKTPTPTPTTTRESSHTQRLKQKQKTPPVVPKQDIHSSFMSPGGVQVTPDSMQQKQKSSNSTSLPLVPSQKQYRLNTETSNNIDQDIKSQVDNSGRRLMGFNMPETVHNSLSNKNVTAAAAVVDTKPKLESFDGTDSLMLAPNQRSKPRSQQQNSSLTNGLHSSLVKQEFSLMDPSSFIVKPELPDQLLSNEIPSDLMYSRSENKVMDFLSFPESVVKTEHTTEPDLSLKQDSFALHKSPQSISALLQEPLAPMPSLLQVPNYEQQPAVVENKLSHQIQQQQQMPPEPLLPSTVDMSELVAPIQCTVDIPAPMTTAASVPVSSAAVVSSASLASSEEKKQEHRSKSEKKKKEKKHKHKEKEKSKEKHKHKHKDKDKEKHHRDKSDREKDKTDEGNSASGSNPGTVPIKITIPKDKLNLSTESIGTSSSTPSSSLKIKIAKERLKGSEVCGQQLQQPQMLQQPQQSVPQPQAPLKIKIRTNEISRSGELQAAANQQQDGTSRKRDRSDGMDGTMVIGAPPTKKPQHQQQQQQPQQQQQQSQRPNERQNGRHSYSNSGSSNKVRGVGRGVGHPRPPPYPYPPQYALAQQHLRGESGYRGYQQQRQSPPAPAFLRHPRPPPHHPYYNYPPAAAAPPVFAAVGYGPAGVFADPALYYQYQQQQQQQQYAMYTTAGLMMTADGQIDTSVPPPSLASQSQALGQTASDASKFVGEKPAPPLPNGPPPSSSPPPPPPPE